MCVPNKNGFCAESSCTLRRIYISPRDYAELAGQIEKLVVRGSDKRARQWADFKKFLAARQGKQVAVVD